MVPAQRWTPTPVSELPSWEGAKRVAIDIETRDPQLKKLGPGVRRDGFICGISFKIEDHPSPGWYLPVRHSEGNLPIKQVFDYLRDQSRIYRGLVVGGNLQYDLDYLWQQGIDFPKIAGYRDIQIAEPLIDDLQMSYSVENIAQRYGIPGKDYGVLEAAAEGYGITKHEMYKLPSWHVAEYAIQDVAIPLTINRRQDRKIEEPDCDGRTLEQIYQLECRLLPALLRMRRRGVRVSLERLEAFEKLTIVEQQIALQKICDHTGVMLSLGDVEKKEALLLPLKQIGVDRDKIPHTPGGKNAKPQPKIDKVFLKSLNHPVADLLLRARKLSKLRSTFCEGIKRHLVDGRIHTTFNQLRMNKDEDDDDGEGGRYGRLSSTDPNMQQQPNPDKDPEFAKPWRMIYLPEEGMEWFANDYSAQEPRQLVHFAEICGCRKAFEAAERYRTDPKTDPHTLTAQLIAGQGPEWIPSKKERGEGKIIALGLAYAMGGAKLAKSLGLPTEWKYIERMGKTIEVAGPEAQALLDKFHLGVPYIRELSYLCQDQVRRKGFIRTLLGRRCHFPEKPIDQRRDDKDTHDWIHKALNRLIQGSSADQTKLATVLVDEAGYYVQLQVHDELDGSCRNREEAEAIGDIMRNCVKLRVPSKVDVEVGPSWGSVS